MDVTSGMPAAAGDERVVADALFGTLYAELHRLARRELNRQGPGGAGRHDAAARSLPVDLRHAKAPSSSITRGSWPTPPA